MTDDELLRRAREAMDGITPGPWRYHMGDVCVEGSDGDDRVIAGIGKSCGARSSVYSVVHNHKPEGLANARLITLAPDLARAYIAAREREYKLREALEKLHHAVCGETGFAECVRNDSGKAYPWPALCEADRLSRAALSQTEGGRDDDQ